MTQDKEREGVVKDRSGREEGAHNGIEMSLRRHARPANAMEMEQASVKISRDRPEARGARTAAAAACA